MQVLQRSTRVVAVLAALAMTAACSSGGSGGPASPGSASPAATTTSPAVAGTGGGGASPGAGGRKVMMIMEENADYDQIIGSPKLPYLNGLATTYGLATSLKAGYPAQCPSLAAYIILTSGSDHGICDDRLPRAHPLAGDSIFSQVVKAGREWRVYAQSMPANCTVTDTPDSLYVVRHAPAPYYVDQRSFCQHWDVTMGTPAAGALHDDVAAGTLPAYSMVTPDTCHDMHGAPSCETGKLAAADAWLADWMPKILAGPDFTSGRLVIFITWDEGTATGDNHIPALVLSSTTRHVTAADAWTHCSTLRTQEDLLGLPPLACAGRTSSMVTAFHL